MFRLGVCALLTLFSYQVAGASDNCRKPLQSSVWLDGSGNPVFSRETREFITWRENTPPHIPDSAFGFARLSKKEQERSVVLMAQAERQLQAESGAARPIELSDAGSEHHEIVALLETDLLPLLEGFEKGAKLRGDIDLYRKFLRVGNGGHTRIVTFSQWYSHDEAFSELLQNEPDLEWYGTGRVLLNVRQKEDSGPLDLLITFSVTSDSKNYVSEKNRKQFRPRNDRSRFSDKDLILNVLTPLFDQHVPGRYRGLE